METGVLVSDFAQYFRGKNPDVSEIDFTLLDAAGISPTPVLNQIAKVRRSWVPFKN